MLPMGVLSGLLLYESPREEPGEGRESEKHNLHFLIMYTSFMPLLALLYLVIKFINLWFPAQRTRLFFFIYNLNTHLAHLQSISPLKVTRLANVFFVRFIFCNFLSFPTI